MSKKVGKWLYEVTCPLCFNIFLCEYAEVHYEKVDREDDEELETDNKKPLLKPYFYCPECNRDVWLQVGDTRYLKDARIQIKSRKGD